MEKLKHYEIIEKIGVGGMGVVYKAFDSILERHVAIKVMHSHLLADEKNDKRFMQEARAAAKLAHPNIAVIYEVGNAESGRFIVMEYIQGDPLAKLLASQKPVNSELAINLTLQILNGLQRAHGMGILHRDIKPDNILITQDNTVKILDFGIAKLQNKQGLTVGGDILGTIEYMAPEQMMGETVDQRCDIYSVGILLYQTLTRQLPFPTDSPAAILYKKLNEDPIPPSHYNQQISTQLDNVILKAICDYENRWPSAQDFAENLGSVLNGASTQPQKIPATPDIQIDSIDGEVESTDQESNAEQFRPVFIGRNKELKKLVNMYGQASHGKGQVVIVAGEAGVGKSTLANQFRRYVRNSQGFVLYGASLYQEGMDAYMPYIDALRGFFSPENLSLSADNRMNLKEMIREKVPLFIEFTEHFMTSYGPPGSNSSMTNDLKNVNLFEGIFQLISLISSIQPTVLIIDDLQWADEASLRLFHYLARYIGRSRIFLLGIRRTDRYDLQKNGKPAMILDMLSRMRREGIFTEIELKPLTRDDSDQLIDKSLTNTVFSEDFYNRLYEKTRGNPFFTLETLKLLHEHGDIYFKEGAWYDRQEDFNIEVPNRVEDVFLRQIRELNDEEREILQVASVIGHKVDISLLSMLLEVSKIKILKTLQRVEQDLQIIYSTEKGYQFEHPMLREMLYREIPTILRQEYHLMIAEELAKRHGQESGAIVGNLAHHFYQGGDYQKAIPLLFQAGTKGFKMSAFQEASVFLENLLNVVENKEQALPESISFSDIFFQLGICYEELGRWEYSLSVYQKLLKIHEENQNLAGQVEAFRRIGRIHDKKGDWEVALSYYQRCLQIIEKHPIKNVRSRIYNNIGVIYVSKGDLEQALHYFNQTIHSVDSDMGQYDMAHAFTNMGIIANMRHDHKAALKHYHQALEIYSQRQDNSDKARVYLNIGMTQSDLKHWTESIDSFKQCLELADESEDKQLIAMAYLNTGKAYARQEEPSKANEYAIKAYRIFKRMGDELSLAEVNYVLGLIHGARDNFQGAAKYLKDSIRVNQQMDYPEGLAESCYTYADLLRENGDIEQAKEYYQKASEAFEKLKLNEEVEEIKDLINKLSQLQDSPTEETTINL